MNQRFFIKGFMLTIFSLAQASILTPSATLAAPGVGSVPLPQLSHSVSPLSYGAKGDGVNDDTAAFQLRSTRMTFSFLQVPIKSADKSWSPAIAIFSARA